MMARAAIEMDGVQDLPESDRLADFPHPRMTSELFGHDGQMQEFRLAAQSGRLHHAWLLTGPKGIGKATFAYHCIRQLLTQGGIGDLSDNQSARLITRMAHPHLLVIRKPFDSKTKKFASTIPVDEVRRLRPFVGKTADAGQWRVVLIDTANDLNNAAANALLKVLEEPPRQTVFLLVAPQPGGLLATIRSRCRTLSFEPLRGEAFSKALNAAWQHREDGAVGPLPPARISQLEHIAQGSIGRALLLTDQDGEALVRQIDRLFQALPNPNWSAVRSFADEVSTVGQDSRFQLAMDLILQRISALIKAQATGEGTEDDLELARRVVRAHTVASWAELWERGVRERAETQALNLDRKALILSVFSGLAQASAEAQN